MINSQKVKELNYDHHDRMAEDAKLHSNDARNLDNESMRALIGPVPEVTKILELGASDGNQWHVLEEKGTRIYGIDLYKPLVKKAQEEGKMVVEGLVEEMQFDSHSFDLVVSRHVMEHIGDIPKALNNIKRVLKPGGYFAAVTPHYFPDPEPAHVNLFQIQQWTAIYEAFGFEIVEAKIRHYRCEECHIVATV